MSRRPILYDVFRFNLYLGVHNQKETAEIVGVNVKKVEMAAASGRLLEGGYVVKVAEQPYRTKEEEPDPELAREWDRVTEYIRKHVVWVKRKDYQSEY